MNGLCPACRRPYDDANIVFSKPSPEEYVVFFSIRLLGHAALHSLPSSALAIQLPVTSLHEQPPPLPTAYTQHQTHPYIPLPPFCFAYKSVHHLTRSQRTSMESPTSRQAKEEHNRCSKGGSKAGSGYPQQKTLGRSACRSEEPCLCDRSQS